MEAMVKRVVVLALCLFGARAWGEVAQPPPDAPTRSACPAEDQPEWERASAREKRDLLHRCSEERERLGLQGKPVVSRQRTLLDQSPRSAFKVNWGTASLYTMGAGAALLVGTWALSLVLIQFGVNLFQWRVGDPCAPGQSQAACLFTPMPVAGIVMIVGLVTLVVGAVMGLVHLLTSPSTPADEPDDRRGVAPASPSLQFAFRAAH